VREQSRDLLIQLQGLSSRAQGRDPRSEPDAIGLEQIDQALAQQVHRTLEILSGIDLPQLRASIPLLSIQHPEEVRGIVDVILAGDIENDKSLRTLEYVVTILSTEDHGGRRVVVTDPWTVTPQLEEVANQRLTMADSDCLVAERVLENATLEALQDGEIGEVRDRVRRYKEDLGPDILHPQVLTMAVEYNVAMWNRVATEIDSSRSIEQLAEGLLTSEASDEAPEPAVALGRDVVGSKPFAGLVRAFAARIAEQPAEDEAAEAIVAQLALEALRVEDVELFGSEEPDEATWIMREALVLGLLLRRRARVEPALSEIGLDPELLATQGVDDLMTRMGEMARKRFGDSNYGDAFRLSDVKTHALAEHIAARMAPRPSIAMDTRRTGRSEKSGAGLRLIQLFSDRHAWQVWLAGLLLVAVFALPTLAPRSISSIAGREELARISPFLERGRFEGSGESSGFFGYVGPTWNYLGTSERERVASEIGAHFERRGVPLVEIRDADRRIVAEYQRGELTYVLPASAQDTLRPGAGQPSGRSAGEWTEH
jgi:hypothetical protein